MPPKRPLRRPLGPILGASMASSTAASTQPPTRTALHTQELILFSSPVTTTSSLSAVPAKRSSSSAHRHGSRASSNATTAPLPTSRGLTASSTSPVQHPPPRPAHAAVAPRIASSPFAASASASLSSAIVVGAGARSHATAYESLPANYDTGLTPATPYSSEIHHASSSTCPTAAGRISSPPPKRGSGSTTTAATAANGLTTSNAAPDTEEDGGFVATGSRSRVIRLLRDARAAVRDPIRPETPLDTSGGAANRMPYPVSSSPSSSVMRQPFHGSSEPRLRRRLPVGGRLAPMSTPAAGSISASGSLPSSPLLAPVPSGGASLATIRASQEATAAVDRHRSAAAQRGITSPMDAAAFAQRYAASQQLGEKGLVEGSQLLRQVRSWLCASTAAASTGAYTLTGAAVACLQSQLLHFNTHWPSGTALRGAVANFSVLNVSCSVGDTQGGAVAFDEISPLNVPLGYAEVTLLAASVMLQAYPAASLIAEPVSLHALLSSLHSIVAAGLATWLAQEETVLVALLELLRLLACKLSTGTATTVTNEIQQELQWTAWLLDIFVCCCEEASRCPTEAVPTTATTTTATGVGEADPLVESSSILGGTQRVLEEQDVIHGTSLVENEAPSVTERPQRMTSAPMLPFSSRTSLSLPLQVESRMQPHSPLGGSLMSQGSAASFLRRNGPGNESQPQPRRVSVMSLDVLLAQLLSAGLLPVLQELSARALTQAATPDVGTATSESFCSLLPSLGMMYRFIAQSHTAALRAHGALDTLTSMLHYGAADTALVEAVARTLVKLTYDEDAFKAMKPQPSAKRVLDTAAHALRTQLRLRPQTAQLAAAAAGPDGASIDLLVSRLCGVMARVAESSAEQQAYLANPAMTHVLELLAARYLTVPESIPAQASALSASLDEQHGLPPVAVLQAVVWVLGIAAMSPHCSQHLVEHVTPQLISLLEYLREIPSMQLTAVYVLMCLSNFSYFFNKFEAAGASPSATAPPTEWLANVIRSLGLLLAYFLFEDNAEATVEATRILGNVSYTNAGRDWMEANKCDEVMVLFMGHEDLRIVYNCCGVLLNLTAATPCRVVEDARLLQMLLSYTARYTKEDTLQAAAAHEEERLRLRRRTSFPSTVSTGTTGDAEAAALWTSQAASNAVQVGDLTEKLLLNIHGLIALSS